MSINKNGKTAVGVLLVLGASLLAYGYGANLKVAAQVFGALLVGMAGNLVMELAKNNDST